MHSHYSFGSFRNSCVLLLLLMLSSSYVFGQSGRVTLYGRLFSPQEEKGVAYGTVSVRLQDSLITGALCDSLGNFTIPKLPNGELVLECSAMGYATVRRSILVDRANGSKMSIDTVNMPIDQVAIDAVRIKGGESFVSLKPNRKVVTLSSEDVNSGRELTELLERLPDFSGKLGNDLLLRGKPFKLLINGQPTGQGAEALNTLNMKDIESIEVITTPMAKYRAESSGGIVNVIMKRPSLGVNAVVQANANLSQHYRLSVSANMRIKKINLFAGLFGYLDRGHTILTIKKFKNDTLKTQIKDDLKKRSFTLFPKIGFDLYPTQRDQLSVFYSGRFRLMNGEMSETLDNQLHLMQINNKSNVFDNSVTGLYAHQFTRENTYLRFSSNFLRYDFPKSLWSLVNLRPPTPTSRRLESLAYYNQSANTLDFSISLLKGLGLESGLAADFTWADYDMRFGQNKKPAQRIRYKAFTKTLGAYSTLTYVLGKITLNGGARYEFYTQSLTPVEGAFSAISRSYHDIFGSGGISYAPLQGLSFSLSYSGRIERPVSYALIPITGPADFSSEFLIGNPDLTPAYAHKVELNYYHSISTVSINADVSWSYVKDEMSRIYSRTSDGTTLRKTVNLDYYSSLYMASRISWNATSWLSLHAYGNAQRADAKPKTIGEGREVNGAWSGNVGAEIDFIYKKLGFLAIWGGYESPSEGAYRDFGSYFDLNAMISWRINSQWRVFAQGSNLLNQAYRYSARENDIRTEWGYNYGSFTFSVGVYYRIGKSFRSLSGEDVFTRTLSTSTH